MRKLFISHASEDKDAFVRPLAEALKTEFDVWYDEYQLVVGMSLFEEIGKGLSTCDYGVVVLSKNFFAKKWTREELNGLFNLEEEDKKIILPVWHKITENEVKKYSPMLADRLAAKAEDGIPAVVNALKQAVAYFERGKSVQAAKSGSTKFISALQRKKEENRSEGIVNSSRGVIVAGELANSTVMLFASHINGLINEGVVGIKVEGPRNVISSYNAVTHCSINIWVGNICLSVGYLNKVVNSACDARLQLMLKNCSFDDWGDLEEFSVIEQDAYFLFITENDESLWKAESDRILYTPEDLVNTWLAIFSDSLEE
jgi:hypothetical protein